MYGMTIRPDLVPKDLKRERVESMRERWGEGISQRARRAGRKILGRGLRPAECPVGSSAADAAEGESVVNVRFAAQERQARRGWCSAPGAGAAAASGARQGPRGRNGPAEDLR
jgi:hypothetical protein